MSTSRGQGQSEGWGGVGLEKFIYHIHLPGFGPKPLAVKEILEDNK